MPRPLTILCLASFFKGNRFLQECSEQGHQVWLLTTDKCSRSPWPREVLDAFLCLPGKGFHENTQAVVDLVLMLNRLHAIDRVVALEEYDLEAAARLRRHLGLPGLDEATAHPFRDKLLMRQRARAGGVLVPDFVPALDPAAVAGFLREVPGPWLLKPRRETGTSGIQPLHRAEEVEPLLVTLGARREHYLLEQMIPGDLYHVDALTSERRVVFAETHRYLAPLLQIAREGGVYGTQTLPRGGDEERALRALHDPLLSLFGLERGTSHTEFIRSRDDGRFYFLETAARVGGGHISELVEASTGLNLWQEWARLELAGSDYRLPSPTRLYAGVVNCLTRQAQPDTRAYDDPEIWSRVSDPHRAGFVLRASSSEQLSALLTRYESRLTHDFPVDGLTLRSLEEAEATRLARERAEGA